MNETDLFSEKEKLNTSTIGDDPEALRNLEAALESGIDDLEFSKPVSVDLKKEGPVTQDENREKDTLDEEEFSEFEDEEDDWKLFKKRKTQKKGPDSRKSGNAVIEEMWEQDQQRDQDTLDEDIPEEDQTEEEDWPLVEEEEPSESDGEDAGEQEDDYEDLIYLQSEEFRKRAKRTLSYEEREARRVRRIELFWDFVDRRRKQIHWVSVCLFVLIAAAVATILVRHWTYRSLHDLIVSEKEDTLSASYANINGKILKYGVDSAMLVDHNNDMLWTVSYDMNDPEVTKCGDTFAIYDSKGTSICICDISGRLGEVSTDKPIVKANVSRQGVVAAVLEDGQNAWIKTYTKDGSEIATLKTTFTNPGYPMDLALSEDGTLLAVDYLYIDNGTPVSRISFYNFGTVGQNQKDNLVAETDYRDRILPEISYMDSKTCVVFREDGFSIYTGSQIPSESVKVDLDQTIVSTFHDSEYIGLVLQNRNSEKEYLICLYNKKGKEIFREETDFHYQSVELNEGEVVLSSRDEFCVYNLQGVQKYRGVLEVPARVFIGFGRNKYIYVTEDIFKIVQIS